MQRKVALVTGATRGIGRACALALADAGFDLVITGRTRREGEGTATRPFLHEPGTVPVPGSLETTAREVRERGREVLALTMDVLDRGSIDAVFAEIARSWGRIDVLVNNALYQGPGLMYPFAEFEIEQLEKSAIGNLVNQAWIARQALAMMRAQGGGIYISLSSEAALAPPTTAVPAGGWGFVYGAPKSGFHRIAEFIHLEHAHEGIVAFNVEPGFTVTESTIAMFGGSAASDFGKHATEPRVTGEVVAWLCTAPEARELAGTLISSPGFFARRNA